MYPLTRATPVLLALMAGTLATAAAQNSAPSNSQPSNMDITVSDGPNCNRDSYGVNYTVPLPYGDQNTNFNNDSMQILSYSLSRATTRQEQLDFSGPTKGMGALNGDPAQCTLFHETTSPDSNGNTLAAGVCYGLLNGPAECIRFWVRD